VSPPPQPKPDPLAWFLPSLVAATRGTELRPRVTLSVGGLLILGELTDAAAYYADLRAQTQEALASASQNLRDRLQKLLNDFEYLDTQLDKGGAHFERAEPAQIYVRIAKVFHPSGEPIPVSGGYTWRVNLRTVEAFSLDLPDIGHREPEGG
jgi:hypothetical protein